MRNLTIAFFAVILTGVACQKEKEDVLDEYAEDFIVFPEELEEHDGLMLAVMNYINTLEVTGTPIIQEFAYAEFKEEKFVDVGIVRLNGNLLFKVPSNQYVSMPDDIGFKLKEGIRNKWQISGGNSFQQINQQVSMKMPGLVTFEEPPSEINLSEPITLRIKNYPAQAEGVIWIVRDVDGKTIQKETKTAEITISAADLGELRSGAKSLIKVVAYASESWGSDGKKYLFLNETADMMNVSFD